MFFFPTITSIALTFFIRYTIELRDTGNYGFQLPPVQIIPTGEENWAGLKAFVNEILSTATNSN
jgi:hypothetical protein